MRNRSALAFTIIELLVILAIIGVLAVLILAAVNSVRNSAMQVKNVANLRRIGMALLTYANDYQGDLPPSSKDDTWGMGAATWGFALTGAPRYLYTSKWGASFKGRQDYLDTPDVFYSPFVQRQAGREKGKFYQEGNATYLGYILYWSPSGNGFTDLSNTNIYRASPRAPIYSDFCAEQAIDWKYSSSQCSVLYLDGSVKTFALKEVNKGKFASDRLKLFMTP